MKQFSNNCVEAYEAGVNDTKEFLREVENRAFRIGVVVGAIVAIVSFVFGNLIFNI